MPETLQTLTRSDLDAAQRQAQAVLDSHTPPTPSQHDAACMLIADCRVERERRDRIYDDAALAYCRGDRSPAVLAVVKGGRK